MIIDLHNHTILCNHAEGSMEEYIQAAIAKKIDVFGFSDHAPMNFDEAYRMGFHEMENYEKEFWHLKINTKSRSRFYWPTKLIF